MVRHAKHLPAKERQGVIVEAVINLAGEKNPDEITTTAIAKHMNLTQGALFRHFPTKASIWEAVVVWVSDQLMNRLDKAVEGIESPLAAMQAMFMAHIDFVAKHPGAPRMLLGELQRKKLSPAKQLVTILFRKYETRLLVHIEKGKAAGELRQTLDNEAAATLFIGTIQGLVVQSLLTGDLNRMRKDAPRVFAIYKRGIEATP
ncbi:MAG: TetR/AcrR family transcriptional regulator [Rhodobacteraceae bacterium]|nr:TetR/AcrR family transcriptional regulator [Paracoccaceae bacterium]